MQVVHTEIFLDDILPVVGQHRALEASAGNDHRIAREQALVAAFEASGGHLVEHCRHGLHEDAFAVQFPAEFVEEARHMLVARLHQLDELIALGAQFGADLETVQFALGRRRAHALREQQYVGAEPARISGMLCETQRRRQPGPNRRAGALSPYGLGGRSRGASTHRATECW